MPSTKLSPDVIKKYFEDLHSQLSQHGFLKPDGSFKNPDAILSLYEVVTRLDEKATSNMRFVTLVNMPPPEPSPERVAALQKPAQGISTSIICTLSGKFLQPVLIAPDVLEVHDFDVPEGVKVFCRQRGWPDRVTFLEELKIIRAEMNQVLGQENAPVFLIVDRQPFRKAKEVETFAKDHNIIMFKTPPNSIQHLHPVDKLRHRWADNISKHRIFLRVETKQYTTGTTYLSPSDGLSLIIQRLPELAGLIDMNNEWHRCGIQPSGLDQTVVLSKLYPQEYLAAVRSNAPMVVASSTSTPTTSASSSTQTTVAPPSVDGTAPNSSSTSTSQTQEPTIVQASGDQSSVAMVTVSAQQSQSQLATVVGIASTDSEELNNNNASNANLPVPSVNPNVETTVMPVGSKSVIMLPTVSQQTTSRSTSSSTVIPPQQEEPPTKRPRHEPSLHRLTKMPNFCGSWDGKEWRQVKDRYAKRRCGCTMRIRTYCSCDPAVPLCTMCYAKHLAEVQVREGLVTVQASNVQQQQPPPPPPPSSSSS